MVELVSMPSSFCWTRFDRTEDDAGRGEADKRLEGWARWQRSSGIHTDYPPASAIERVMKPSDIEEQAGARHVSSMPSDAEAEEIDRILAQIRIHPRQFRYWKLAQIEYCTYGSQEVKAKMAGLPRMYYRHRLQHLQLLVAHALETAKHDGR